jgi:hypothetical protein
VSVFTSVRCLPGVMKSSPHCAVRDGVGASDLIRNPRLLFHAVRLCHPHENSAGTKSQLSLFQFGCARPPVPHAELLRTPVALREARFPTQLQAASLSTANPEHDDMQTN